VSRRLSLEEAGWQPGRARAPRVAAAARGTSQTQGLGRRPLRTRAISQPPAFAAAVARTIAALAAVRIRAGYQVDVLRRRESWRVNHKRVYRLYGEEGLALRRRRPQGHRSAVVRVARSGSRPCSTCTPGSVDRKKTGPSARLPRRI
jgi:hypothetical protein